MDLTEAEIKQIDTIHDLIEGKHYYELFDLDPNADIDEIKRAYFSTSRKWHPDRFFRRNIGDFREKLEQIFIGINKAYSILSSKEDRILYDRDHKGSAKKQSNDAPKSSTFISHRRNRGRIKKEADQRKKHTGRKEKIIQKVKKDIESQDNKAQNFFEIGKKQLEEGKPMEAAASLHVAYKLMPQNEEYKTLYKKSRMMAREEKAKTIFAQAENAENYQNYHDAIRLYRQALEYDIVDPRAYARLAYLIEKLEPDVRETIRLMRIAIEKAPENPEYRCILAEMYAREGMILNAKREYTQALKIQKGYIRAKEGLKNL